MRLRPLVPLVLAGAASVVAASVAAANPEIALQAGRTFAVSSPELTWRGVRPNGEVVYQAQKPDGGYAVSASVLWPWAERFRFGLSMHAVDAGSWRFEESSWRAATGTTGSDFGTLQIGQLDAWGGAWRADILGPAIGRVGYGFASVSYGYYRWKNDRPGFASLPAAVSDSLTWEVPGQSNPGAAQSGVGASLALGIERSFGERQTFGLSISGTTLSSDFTRRYLGAHLEWRWRL
jgi:hypothetical protein